MNTPLIFEFLDTPVGRLRLLSDGTALTRIEFANRHSTDGRRGHDAVIERTRQQLQQYFAGQRQQFDLPLEAGGTAFQRQVWRALAEIPFGALRSYRDIARRIGNERAVRAVGAANGRNPIPVVVPCHRVIGSDGSLTGFTGGLAVKRALLQLEGAQL